MDERFFCIYYEQDSYGDTLEYREISEFIAEKLIDLFPDVEIQVEHGASHTFRPNQDPEVAKVLEKNWVKWVGEYSRKHN